MTVIPLDNFNRADENPISAGGSWSLTTPGSTVGLKSSSGKAIRQDATSVFGRNGNFWNPVTFAAGDPCAAYHTVGNAGSDGETDVGFFNSASTVGYYMSGTVGTFGTSYELVRMDTGYAATVIGSQFARSLTANDRMQIVIESSDIVALLDTGSGFTQIVRVRDTTYRLAWRVYWEIAGFNDVASASIDDTYAGSLSNSGSAVLDPLSVSTQLRN